MKNRIPKSVQFGLVGISIFLFSLAFWFSGKSQRNLNSLHQKSIENPEFIEEYQQHLERLPQSHQQYNLSTIYSTTKNYPEAIQLLQEARLDSEIEPTLIRNILYNLGVTQFQQSLQENSLETRIQYLKESLQNFKDVLNLEKGKEASSDTSLNYAIVRKHLKNLLDKKKEEEQETQQQQDPYELLTELIKQEQEIQQLLDLISSIQDPQEKVTIENKLHTLRNSTQERYHVIQKLLLQAGKTNND